MEKKHALMLTMLITGLAMLAGCNKRDETDAIGPDVTSTPALAEGASAAPMPVATMPSPDSKIGDGASFAEMDKNHDGGVTKDELMDTDTLYQQFSAVDTDHDGKLSQTEIIWHAAEMKAKPAK